MAARDQRLGTAYLAEGGQVACALIGTGPHLRRAFGASYDEHAARVPAVVPGLRFMRRGARAALSVGRMMVTRAPDTRAR